MIKLAKYLKGRIGYILAILVLLFLQAFCDLELPNYTSKIVNEGIQQKGVVDGVPDQIRASTYDDLKLFMTVGQQEKMDACYTLDGEIYVLNEMTAEEREALNHEIAPAEVVLAMISQGAAMQNAAGEETEGGEENAGEKETQSGIGFNMMAIMGGNGADPMAQIRLMPDFLRNTMLTTIQEKLQSVPDAMISQYAIVFVQSEYREIGIDLDARQTNYLLSVGLRMLGLAFLAMMATVCVTFLSARMAAGTAHDIRNDIYRKVIGFNSAEFNHFSTASLITRSTNDVQQIQMFLAMGFRMVLYAPILGIGGVLKVIDTDVSMSWILALAVGLILILIFILFKVAMPKFTILQTLIDRLNLVSREELTGVMVTRAFSAEQHEEARFEEANRNLTRTNLFVNRCMTFMMPIMMLIMNGLSVLIVYNGAYAIDGGTMQVGDMMAFIQYAMQIIMSFLMISMMSILIPRANVAGKRICEVLETQATIHNPENPKTPESDEKGTVEFDHVSFAYPDAEEKVLEDVSFKAEKGQTVAFIGSTGSGKSTLINLIPRFFDVTDGAVRVDGVDVREMSKEDLCSRLGYVPQKSILFSGTIDSNIRYGITDASEEDIKAAAAIAQATDFIEAKEEQYHSPIAQGGTNVSGGQKQRLSIARAIAKKPEILIFDDSFSALDFKTDVALRRALKEATKDTTMLIVAQRISTILHADQIIVLDEGKVAGQGTHAELMKDCEVYRQIATSQLSEEELAR